MPIFTQEARALRESESIAVKALARITEAAVKKAEAGSVKHQELLFKYHVAAVRERVTERLHKKKSSMMPQIVMNAIMSLPVSGVMVDANGRPMAGRGRARRSTPQDVVVEARIQADSSPLANHLVDNKASSSIHNRILSDPTSGDFISSFPGTGDHISHSNLGRTLPSELIGDGQPSVASTQSREAEAATAIPHPSFSPKILRGRSGVVGDVITEGPRVIGEIIPVRKSKSGRTKAYMRRFGSRTGEQKRVKCTQCGIEFFGFGGNGPTGKRYCKNCRPATADFSLGKEFKCMDCGIQFTAGPKGPNERRCPKCRKADLQRRLESMNAKRAPRTDAG